MLTREDLENDALRKHRDARYASLPLIPEAEFNASLERILAGWNPTPATQLTGHVHSSDGFEDFPRYLECWGGANPVHYAGSIVVGFASVYTRSGANMVAMRRMIRKKRLPSANRRTLVTPARSM